MKAEPFQASLNVLSHGELEIAKNRSLVMPAFFRLRDVLRITSLSRPTLYRRIAAHRFPAPVHLGGRASAWTFDSLQSWIADPEGYRSHAIDEQPARRRGRPRKYGIG
jgi:prophage regulatory protein